MASKGRRQRNEIPGLILTIVSIAVVVVGAHVVSSQEKENASAADEKDQRTRSVLAALPNCERAIPAPEPASLGQRRGPASEKVAGFNILGVSLYDPVQQVLATLGQSPDFLHDPSYVSLTYCVSDQMERDRQERAGKLTFYEPEHGHCVERLTFQSSDRKSSFSVEFVEDLPAHPGCMVAGGIHYDQAPPSAVEMAAPDAALIRKYGSPSFHGHERMSWGEYGRASLEYTWLAFQRGYALTLKDQRFMDTKHDAYFNAYHSARPVTEPKF